MWHLSSLKDSPFSTGFPRLLHLDGTVVSIGKISECMFYVGRLLSLQFLLSTAVLPVTSAEKVSGQRLFCSLIPWYVLGYWNLRFRLGIKETIPKAELQIQGRTQTPILSAAPSACKRHNNNSLEYDLFYSLPYINTTCDIILRVLRHHQDINHLLTQLQ